MYRKYTKSNEIYAKIRQMCAYTLEKYERAIKNVTSSEYPSGYPQPQKPPSYPPNHTAFLTLAHTYTPINSTLPHTHTSLLTAPRHNHLPIGGAECSRRAPFWARNTFCHTRFAPSGLAGNGFLSFHGINRGEKP